MKTIDNCSEETRKAKKNTKDQKRMANEYTTYDFKSVVEKSLIDRNVCYNCLNRYNSKDF